MVKHSTSSFIEGIVEDTYRVVKKIASRIGVINYPKGSSKAFDIVSSGDNQRLFIRVIDNADILGKNDIVELKASSKIYDATPLIVAKYARGYEIEDDVVYEKHGVYVISVNGLRNVVEKKEPIYIVNYKGLYLIRVNPEKLKERRLEKGLSLGDLANVLGVSRKTVYEYERGNMSLTIDKALRLLDLFGEEVFEPIDVLEKPGISDKELCSLSNPDTHIEAKVLRHLRSLGYSVVHLKRTPVDVIGCRTDVGETVSIIIKHYISSRSFRIKVSEADKIVEITGSKRYVVEAEKDLGQVFSELTN